MNRILRTSRIAFIFVVVAILLSIYTSALYELQIKEGDSYLEASRNAIAMTKTIPAARGAILDRDGELLVYTKTVYNITLTRSTLMRNESPNSVIYDLCMTAEEHGISYTDTFPVTRIGPFSYVADMNEEQRSRLNDYFEYFKMDKDISASDLISWMREHYKIDYTVGINDARKIIGIRYEMECRLINGNLPEYNFAEDVDSEAISIIEEKEYPGVGVSVSSKRVYNTTYAAHILGYIGKMDKETYAKYKDKPGYNYNTEVGVEGVEAAFEEYLHGVDGYMRYTTDRLGNVTGILYEQGAVAGKNVYLSISLKLQKAAEDALKKTIEDINAGRSEDNKVTGGAVVIRDVNSGEILASASYPTYDLATFRENYTELAENTSRPMFNRAMQGTYNPGSTFKMVTAFAGLKNGTITRYTTIHDDSQYTRYAPDYSPKCWVYPYSHGNVDVVSALEKSCNYFFYWVGDKMGIDPIAEAARQFGFGQKSGVEITEEAGTVASPEYKKKALDEGWWAADTLITAIGQGHNNFTPLQIANYVAAIANGGTVYKTTLLKLIKSADYSRIEYENQPGVLNQIEDNDGYLTIIKQGMRAVAATGTASSEFKNYKVRVAAKTGTVQSDTSNVNSGVFVCYAPYDNPQIAISVVAEGGGSGSAIMSVAKSILDVYFSSDSYAPTVKDEYSLIR